MCCLAVKVHAAAVDEDAEYEKAVHQAQERLNKRLYATTSAQFSNPDGLNFGLGRAISGLIWQDIHVSAETDSTITLNMNQDSPRFKKNDITWQISGLAWQQKERTYRGRGTVFIRSHKDCPVRSVSGTVEVRIDPNAPFAGAWTLIQMKGPAWEERQPPDCSEMPQTRTTTTYSEKREYVTVEYIRAIEQLSGEFSELKVKTEGLLSSREARFIRENPRKALVDIPELDLIREQRDGLTRFAQFISDVEWALKFGGSIDPYSKNKKLESKSKRYEKTDALKAPKPEIEGYVHLIANDYPVFYEEMTRLEIEENSKRK